MKTAMVAVIGTAIGLSILGVILVLAENMIIVVPYLSSTIIKVEGLQGSYPVNASVSYDVVIKGYGSNCQLLKVTTFRGANPANDHDEGNDKGQTSIDSKKSEQVSYYYKADDCRYMRISHQPYNVTKTLSYSGPTIMAVPGQYSIQIEFKDLIDGNSASATKTFVIK